jgi:hypothetical protein
MIRNRYPTEAEDFPLTHAPRPARGPARFSYNVYRRSFPGGKARPGSDSDHSPPLSAEINKGVLPTLPQAPPCHVAGALYLLILSRSKASCFTLKQKASIRILTFCTFIFTISKSGKSVDDKSLGPGQLALRFLTLRISLKFSVKSCKCSVFENRK